MNTLTDNNTQNLSYNEENVRVSAEDIIAALKPLVDEYFLGCCSCEGDALLYTSPEGERFAVKAIAL